MIYVSHRINTVDALRENPVEYGVELDLRDRGDRLIVQHDPFTDGEDFEDYIEHYRHQLMILNIKSERIEYRVLELLKKHGVLDYFFLDSSIGMIYLLSGQGEHNFAMRFSEIEKTENVAAMKDRVKWVWVDCFSKLPIDSESYKKLKQMGLKLCLTSPELHGRHDDIDRYGKTLIDQGIKFDAICTKAHNIDRWEKILNE